MSPLLNDYVCILKSINACFTWLFDFDRGKNYTLKKVEYAIYLIEEEFNHSK